jgi:hypothetical protein
MGDVQSCLQKAIRCNREFRDHLERIEAIQRPEQAVKGAQELVRLEQLQQAVRESMVELAAAFGRDPSASGIPFPTELAELLAETAERTRAATQRLLSLQGLIAAELRQLQDSRSALGGYKSYYDRKGSVLSNAT